MVGPPMPLGHVPATTTGAGARIYPLRNVKHLPSVGTGNSSDGSTSESPSSLDHYTSSGSHASLVRVDSTTPSSSLLPSPGISRPAGSTGTRPSPKPDGPAPEFLGERFKHISGDGGAGFIFVGRGKPLLRCEDEPIHAPGAIQSFGVLLAFDVRDGDDGLARFVVQQVSENSFAILGHTPANFFKAGCLTDLFSLADADELRDAISSCKNEEDNTPFGFELAGTGALGSGAVDSQGLATRKEWRAYCALHRLPGGTRHILEFELVDSIPPRHIRSPPLHDTPLPPVSIPPPLGDVPVALNSTVPAAPPLETGLYEPNEDDERASRTTTIPALKEIARMRRKRDRLRKQAGSNLAGESTRTSDMQLFSLVSQMNDSMLLAKDLPAFYKTTVAVVRDLCEADRCMLYRFDADFNGEVLAEHISDWTSSKDIYKGLRFPAGDIPPQARALYKTNKVRVLYDRDSQTSRMCCRDLDEVNAPLDMSQAFLRAISPIHIQYLRNMGVRSTLAISIVVFGELWGLLVLHGYDDPHRVTFPIRQLCRLLSDSIGHNIERLSMLTRIDARKFINTTPTIENPRGYIGATTDDLLKLFSADFGCLSIGDEGKLLGQGPDNSQELLAILEYLRAKSFATVQVTTDIALDYPDIDLIPKFTTIAGFFSVPLSREGKDFVVFCRRPMLEHVRWAGAKNSSSGGSLEPRKSFQAFSETVQGRCKSWADVEADTPQVLLLIFGRYIDVWRKKEHLLSATRLAHTLLGQASVSVRTPLNSIVTYLEAALDGPLDGETRENVTKSYEASRTLVHVINDLLDLTRTEQGLPLHANQIFNLPTAIAGGSHHVSAEAVRRGLTFEVIESPQGTPNYLLGDVTKIERLVSELTTNALSAIGPSDAGGILIEWGECMDQNVVEAEAKKDSIRIGISITDTGCGISDSSLEQIFRAFEHISSIGEELKPRESGTAGVVGLGLALVARIVKNLNGQLRVQSTLGQGSTFTCILPFRLPAVPTRPVLLSADSSQTTKTLQSVAPHDPSGSPNGGTESPNSVASGTQQSDIDQILESLASSHLGNDGSRRASLGTSPFEPSMLNRTNLARNALLDGRGSASSTAPRSVSSSAGPDRRSPWNPSPLERSYSSSALLSQGTSPVGTPEANSSYFPDVAQPS